MASVTITDAAVLNQLLRCIICLFQENLPQAQCYLQNSLSYSLSEKLLSSFWKKLSLNYENLINFLDLVTYTSHITSDPQHIESLKQIINFAVDRLSQNTSLPISVLIYLAHLENLIEKYENAKKHLELCTNYNDGEVLPRTLAESIIGLWSLENNIHSGIDLQSFSRPDTFLRSAANSLEPLNITYLSQARHDNKNIEFVTFISCDTKYFKKLAIAQVISLLENNLNIGIHFHIMNSQPEDIEIIKILSHKFPNQSFSFSSEFVNQKELNSCADVTYYASARFCRAASFLRIIKKPIIITDADVLFRKSIAPIIQPDVDIQVFAPYIDYPLVPLYARIWASFLVINPTQLGQSYLNSVSYFINIHLKRGSCWTLDQLSLYAVLKLFSLNGLDLKVDYIPFLKEVSDEIHDNISLAKNTTIWTACGSAKFENNNFTRLGYSFLKKFNLEYLVLE